MEWDPDLNTGITMIDNQHRRIVDFINQLHEAAQTSNREKVEEVLNGLVSYTESHFAFEEELMEQHHYSGLEEHKQVHQKFIKRLARHRNQHDRGANIARGLLNELQLWLMEHIKDEDGGYANEINITEESEGLLESMFHKFF